MARTVRVTTKDGKQLDVVVDNILSVEHVPGKPGEPAVEAQEAVKDDPGEEPSATNPEGRPPKKGHPAIKAKDAVPGTPDKVIIKLVNGDTLEAAHSANAVRDAIG